MLETASYLYTVLAHNSGRYLNHKAVSCLNYLSLIFFNYLATPGPGTYVAPSAFGYYLSDQQVVMAIGGVDLSPKLRKKLLFGSKHSRKTNSCTRLSQGLSYSQDRIRFRTKRSSSNSRAQSVPRASSMTKKDIKLEVDHSRLPDQNYTGGKPKRHQQSEFRASSVGRLYSQKIHRRSQQPSKINMLYGWGNAQKPQELSNDRKKNKPSTSI